MNSELRIQNSEINIVKPLGAFNTCTRGNELRTLNSELRTRLILDNQPLAKKIARKVWETCPHLPFDDLYSAGTIGLIKAIDRHNPEKAKLSTFAYPYIYGEIQREIRDKWQPIKIKRSHYDLKNKLRKLDEKELPETAIADALKLSVVELGELRESLAALKVNDDSNSELGVRQEESPRVLIPPGEFSIPNLSPRTRQIFETICCLGRTTTEAIAIELNITQGRARDYTGKLRKMGLITKDGFFYKPNLEPVIVQGIKNQVQQKIEITNFLAKVEELVKLKEQVKQLETELVKQGGDRAKWVLEQVAK